MKIFSRRAAGALLLSVVVSCGGGDKTPAPPAERSVRLLENLAEVEIASGGPGGDFVGRRPVQLELSKGREAPAANSAAAVSGKLLASVPRVLPEGYDRRAALVVMPGTRLIWSRRVSGPHQLHVDLAALAAAAGATAKARFRISAGTAQGPLVILEEVELDAAANTPWRELKVDLPRAGFERLELAVDSGGEALGAWASPELLPVERPAKKRTNLVLISLDTLRPDRLGSYGYSARPTSPNLDRFAARSVRFETAVSQAPWTRPSHRTMLSGIYPASRGGLERRMLAEELYREGYATAGLTSGGQVDARFGFDRGFESYVVDRHWVREPEKAMAHIEADPARPFFLFLHTYEIHDPYEDSRFLAQGECPRFPRRFGSEEFRKVRRRPTPEEKSCVGALYDGDIAFTDEKVGKLLGALEASGRMDDTIVVVTSDHGEQFWEHNGWRHGLTIYEHQLRVPLIVYLPETLRERFASGKPGRRPGAAIESTVALMDLAPSLYELLGIPVTHAMHGRSFVPLLRGESSKQREILSESSRADTTELKSIRTDRFKFISKFSKKTRQPVRVRPYELFELRRDPGEQNDLSSTYPDAVKALVARLDALTQGSLGELDQTDGKNLDEDLRKELQALGYLGDD